MTTTLSTKFYLKYGNMILNTFNVVKNEDGTTRVTEMNLKETTDGCKSFASLDEASSNATHHPYFFIVRESVIHEDFHQDGTPVINGA